MSMTITSKVPLEIVNQNKLTINIIIGFLKISNNLRPTNQNGNFMNMIIEFKLVIKY